MVLSQMDVRSVELVLKPQSLAASIQESQPEIGRLPNPAKVDDGFENSQCDISTQAAEKILTVLKPFLLTKSADAHDRWAKSAPKFISVIRKFVARGAAVQMCLPAFPWKSVNKVYKVLGTLPDKAEELALKRLEGICVAIGNVYRPGAELFIISDGLVNNDLFTIPDRDVWAYNEGLHALAVESGCAHLHFTWLKDLVNIPHLPDTLEEIAYVANAFNFRRALLNQFGNPDLDVAREIKQTEDTRLKYCGYMRFLKSELQYIFAEGENRSRQKFRNDIRYLARQMIGRGQAFAAAVKQRFPDHLRLSIHQSTGEPKFSISLLPTTTSYTTPWTCSVAFLADGRLISGPKGNFEDDPKFELVWEHGRPSYFRERGPGDA